MLFALSKYFYLIVIHTTMQTCHSYDSTCQRCREFLCFGIPGQRSWNLNCDSSLHSVLYAKPSHKIILISKSIQITTLLSTLCVSYHLYMLIVNGDIHVQHPISIFTQKKIKRIVLSFSGKSHNESRVVAVASQSKSKTWVSIMYTYYVGNTTHHYNTTLNNMTTIISKFHWT